MKKLPALMGLTAIFVGSRLLDDYPHAKNLITVAAICLVFAAFVIYRILSKSVSFSLVDLLPGVPIIPLLIMMFLSWYGFITLSYTFIWIVFVAFTVIFLGYYFYRMGDRI